MRYEDFCTEAEIATYKRVKVRSMRLARIARHAAVDVLHARYGEATVGEAGAEYVETRRGRFRLAMAKNSDNTTEAREHSRRGVRTVVMSDDDQMRAFFAEHEFDGDQALAQFHHRVKARMTKL